MTARTTTAAVAKTATTTTMATLPIAAVAAARTAMLAMVAMTLVGDDAATTDADVAGDGGHADGYHQRWLSCRRSTRVMRHYSVTAGSQAA